MILVVAELRNDIVYLILQEMPPVAGGEGTVIILSVIQPPDIGRIQSPVFSADFRVGACPGRCVRTTIRPILPVRVVGLFDLVHVLAAPEGADRRLVDIVNRLDGLLDDGVAGLDDVALAVAALHGLGKDVHLARLGVHELAPQVRIRLWIVAFIARVMLIIVLVDEHGGADDLGVVIVGVRDRIIRLEIAAAYLFLVCFLENVLDELADIHQVRMRRAVPRAMLSDAPVFIIRIFSRIGHPVRAVAIGVIRFVDGKFHPAVVQQRTIFGIVGQIDGITRVYLNRRSCLRIRPHDLLRIFLGSAAHLGSERGLHVPGKLIRLCTRVVGKRDGVIFVVTVGIHDFVVREQEIPLLAGLPLIVLLDLGINAAGVGNGNLVSITGAPERVVIVKR